MARMKPEAFRAAAALLGDIRTIYDGADELGTEARRDMDESDGMERWLLDEYHRRKGRNLVRRTIAKINKKAPNASPRKDDK